MAVMTMIIGKSGTGKTTSMRNLDPNDVALIKAVEKPLPFRAKGWAQFCTDYWSGVLKAAQKAVSKGRSIIVVDDFQYIMANEFMRRSDEKSFDKFTEIARHAWEVIMGMAALPPHVRVYMMTHSDDSDSGAVKAKTIGKLLDEKICLEGLFTIVLRTSVQDGEYLFSTTNSGSDTVKSPMGMFDKDFVENDLKSVDETIKEYYDINNASAETNETAENE